MRVTLRVVNCAFTRRRDKLLHGGMAQSKSRIYGTEAPQISDNSNFEEAWISSIESNGNDCMIHLVLLLYIVKNYIGLLAADHTFIDAARHIQVAKYDMELSLRPEHISSGRIRDRSSFYRREYEPEPLLGVHYSWQQ
eukprot:scaffold15188_cov135-Skeletonema_menzelii.AAC.2